VARFPLICLVLCGCEFAFPLVLDADAEGTEIDAEIDSETRDAASDSPPDAKDTRDAPSDASVWDHKNGS